MPEQNLVLDAPCGSVEVFLQGGPDSIPRTMLATDDQLAYGKIKVPYLAGYEHFERRPGDGSPLLFAWTFRTKIAE
jgi:hypothetical protein